MSISGWEIFIQRAPSGTRQVMRNLATAESLTDEVASELYGLEPVPDLAPDLFMEGLHYCDFIQPRNSEWHIEPAVRAILLEEGPGNPQAHRLLLDIAESADVSLARVSVPGYLFSDGGAAYHLAGLGEPQQALARYAQAAFAAGGDQWLAGQLSAEQERRGLLPAKAIETQFLQAMILFREGARAKARPLFESVAMRDEPRMEVAIAMHIFANMISREDDARAEKLYRRSLAIRESLDDRLGSAKVMHSLGRHLGRRTSGVVEAEDLLRNSRAILEDEGDEGGVGQVQHSLANLLAKDRKGVNSIPGRAEEIEALYRESVASGRKTNDDLGLAQRLHSLGKFLAERSPSAREPEQVFLESISLDEHWGNMFGVAQTEHDFGRYLSHLEGREREAEDRLRRSLELNKANNHQAQVLMTLGLLVERRDPVEAARLLNGSLSADVRGGNEWGQRMVRRVLEQFYVRHPGLRAEPRETD